MRLLPYRHSPNTGRIVYDLGSTALAAAFSYAFGATFLGAGGAYVTFAAPPLVLLCNWTLGLYSRFRIGPGMLKAALLSGSLAITAAAVIFLPGGTVPVGLLWFGLSWSAVTLPRIFLNLNTRVKASLVSSAIQSRGPVLVVGGAGYIGTHTVSELLKANYAVRVLDALLYGPESLRELLRDSRVELIHGDVTDINKLVQAMHGASAVVHLAGLVGDPACAVDESFTRHANVIATRMLKEVAISLGVRRFVFASSCSVYGASEEEVSETSSVNPVSLYARSKIDSEQELLLCPHENFYATALRFATVFGHSRRPRFDLVANLFVAQAMIDGRITVTGEQQWRPFIHVRDVARSVVEVLRADPEAMRKQIINVGDKRLNMTIGQLAECVRSIVSKERPVEVRVHNDLSDRRNYRVSFDKIHRMIGFEATMTVGGGITEIVQEFKKSTYKDYKSAAYSNLEMTKRALSDFQDPIQSARRYRPVADALPLPPSTEMRGTGT